MGILSYVRMFLHGWVEFFPQHFANIGRIRMQLWKENLAHWIFLVRKCSLTSKGRERKFLTPATDNLTNSFKCMPVCIITFTTCTFLSFFAF